MNDELLATCCHTLPKYEVDFVEIVPAIMVKNSLAISYYMCIATGVKITKQTSAKKTIPSPALKEILQIREKLIRIIIIF